MAKKPLSPRIFHDPDGDLLKLTGKTVGIIGYGNQGRAQALNLRDSNIPVIIGNRKDDYMERAIADNFELLMFTGFFILIFIFIFVFSEVLTLRSDLEKLK